MARFDLSTAMGRFRAHWHYFWADHAFLRLAFSNAHWLGPDLVRTNQPSPRQLAYWKKKGVKTVINLRGQRDEGYYWLEKEACERRARRLFTTIEYPVLIHCKSGADRAGMMAVFYRHFHLGEPISVAMAELSKKYLHSREGLTGVLDYTLEKYVSEIEPRGISFIDWIDSPDYDPKAIRAEFKAGWWGTLLTEKLLKRE